MPNDEEHNARMMQRALDEWRASVPHLEEILNMPNISDMIQSKYLRKEDIPQPVIVSIRGVQLESVGRGRDGEDDQKWIMYFNELPKGLRLNKTILVACAAAFGPETELWTGKRVKLFNDPTITMAGQVVGGLRIKTPSIPAQNLVAGAVPPRPAGPPAGNPQYPPGWVHPQPGTVALPAQALPGAPPFGTPPAGEHAEFDDDIPF